MKHSEFRRAVAEEFGEAYGPVLIRDHWLRAFSGTVTEALERGVAPRRVWEALCEDLGVPAERRYGRGLREPESP